MTDDLAKAIRVLTAAGAQIVLPSQRHFSLGNAAQMLDCSKGWIREHLGEFPNAWRMPGGELRVPEQDVADAKRRVQAGELRIPGRDLEELAKRCRLAVPPGRTQQEREAA
jgi:hypothetical protein